MHKLWDWVYESTFWGPTFRSCHNTEVSVSRSPQTCQLHTSWSHISFIFLAQIMKTHFMLGRQKETSPKATGKNENTKGKNPTLHLTTYSTPSKVKPYFTHQKTRSNLLDPSSKSIYIICYKLGRTTLRITMKIISLLIADSSLVLFLRQGVHVHPSFLGKGNHCNW